MNRPRNWIEVVDGNAGHMKLQHRTASYNGLSQGSHQVAWIAFYNAVSVLSSFLTSNAAVIAKTPVNNKETWLIETRNDVNYVPQSAFNLAEEFENSYVSTTVPGSIGGRLNTMMSVSQACALLAKESALRVGLKTDAILPEIDRKAWLSNRVTHLQADALTAYTAAEVSQFQF